MSGPRAAGLPRWLHFGVAGVVGLAVDLAMLYAVQPGLGWYAGRALSFWAAATATWLLNRHWAFGDRAARRPHGVAGEYLRYLASMLVGGAVNYAAYVGVLQLYGGPGRAAAGVAVGSVCGMSVNFYLAHRVVFRP